MKIKGTDFAELLDMIRATNAYHNKDAYLSNGLSEKRWRWDCVWAIPNEERKAWFDKIYEYANDDHIDTALRKITKYAP